VPALAGSALPLTSIVAGTKFCPVPDASICTVLMDREPSEPASKPVALTEKVSFKAAATELELSSDWAILTLPQGLLVLGR